MELNKKKYKQSEVEEIVKQIRREYEDKFNEEKDELTRLLKENKTLKASLDEYKNKETLINSAIVMAEEKAREIEIAASKKYALEVENLKMFYLRFKGYFDYLTEKYPYYPAVTDAKEVYEKLISTVNSDLSEAEKIDSAEKAVLTETVKLGKKEGFDPKQIMNDYIAATGDNGFDLDQVLNPGELHLEDLCKELGLIEEE